MEWAGIAVGRTWAGGGVRVTQTSIPEAGGIVTPLLESEKRRRQGMWGWGAWVGVCVCVDSLAIYGHFLSFFLF